MTDRLSPSQFFLLIGVLFAFSIAVVVALAVASAASQAGLPV